MRIARRSAESACRSIVELLDARARVADGQQVEHNGYLLSDVSEINEALLGRAYGGNVDDEGQYIVVLSGGGPEIRLTGGLESDGSVGSLIVEYRHWLENWRSLEIDETVARHLAAFVDLQAFDALPDHSQDISV